MGTAKVMATSSAAQSASASAVVVPPGGRHLPRFPPRPRQTTRRPPRSRPRAIGDQARTRTHTLTLGVGGGGDSYQVVTCVRASTASSGNADQRERYAHAIDQLGTPAMTGWMCGWAGSTPCFASHRVSDRDLPTVFECCVRSSVDTHKNPRTPALRCWRGISSRATCEPPSLLSSAHMTLTVVHILTSGRSH